MTTKASMEELNGLHAMVAKQLADNLDDPKTLALAVKFLKDNDITADILESESLLSITESIKKIAASDDDSFSVEDMLGMSH